MDGLLIDSEPLWVRAEMEVFGSLGVPLSEEDCATTKGLRIDEVIVHWKTKRGFQRGHDDPKQIQKRLVARVMDLVSTEGRALPGIETAIASARRKDRRIALASSSPMVLIDAALRRLDLAG